MEKSYKEYLHNITTFIFDVDGVLTDGKLHITTEGQMHRTMNVKDGYAIKAALDAGYNICIISGGTDEGVRKDIAAQNILYMGDDIPDYPVMQFAGLACCPQDAVKEIKDISNYISHKNGGQGCVRDVIEQVLKVQGNWMKNIDAAAH